jgi:5-carboxymethyl-2-hydroxymuconate isomerase
MKEARVKNSDKILSIGKIVCVGKNYMDHIKEFDGEIPEKPVLFLKPPSAVIYNGGKIIHPGYANDLQYEAELILLIKASIKNALPDEAEKAIAGYGVGIDATMRDEQFNLKKRGLPWTTSKCFDTSAPISDFISSEDYHLTLEEELSLIQNGTVKQKESLKKMIFPPVSLVQYISSVMTLEKGDIIFTGTPAGVGNMYSGDKITAEITGIAKLDVTVE